MSQMTYNHLERSESDFTAETFGLWPGIAGVSIENLADVFCRECAKDLLGKDLMERLEKENPGYDHDKANELGNVTVVLSDSEFDCPGAYCGNCGIELDVSIIHYEGVCGEYCPENLD